MGEIILIRHAEACSGPSGMDRDFHLTPRGRRQAHRLGRELAEMRLSPVRIYCSTLTRSRETAAIVAKHVPASVVERTDLIEHGSHVLTLNCSLRSAARRHPGRIQPNGALLCKQGRCDGLNWSFSIGGECLRQLHRRALAAWHGIASDVQRNEVVLVVSHGSLLSAMLTEVLGLPLLKVWRFNFANTGHVRIRLACGPERLPVLCA